MKEYDFMMYFPSRSSANESWPSAPVGAIGWIRISIFFGGVQARRASLSHRSVHAKVLGAKVAVRPLQNICKHEILSLSRIMGNCQCVHCSSLSQL